MYSSDKRSTSLHQPIASKAARLARRRAGVGSGNQKEQPEAPHGGRTSDAWASTEQYNGHYSCSMARRPRMRDMPAAEQTPAATSTDSRPQCGTVAVRTLSDSCSLWRRLRMNLPRRRRPGGRDHMQSDVRCLDRASMPPRPPLLNGRSAGAAPSFHMPSSGLIIRLPDGREKGSRSSKARSSGSTPTGLPLKTYP